MNDQMTVNAPASPENSHGANFMSTSASAALGRSHTLILAGLLLTLLAAAAVPPVRIFPAGEAYAAWHTALEIFVLAVSFQVFAVGWTGHHGFHSRNALILSCAFLAVGLLDALHTLSFPGMPDFITPNAPEKAIHFWMSARAVCAAALFTVALLPWSATASPTARYGLLASALLVTGIFSWAILFRQEDLPRVFIPEYGLTTYKLAAEYAIIFVLGLAATLLFTRLHRDPAEHTRHLFMGVCVIALGELFFTLFREITDVYNQLGHLYKVIGYVFVYRALVAHAVREPYELLQRSERLLKENKERLELALEGSNLIQVDIEAKTGLIRLSEGWTALLGQKPRPVVLTFREFLELAHPEHRKRIKKHCVDVLKGRTGVCHLEYRVKTRSGQWKWIHSHGRVVERDAGGNAARIAGTSADVTDRKRAEYALRESEARLSSIVNSAMHAIIMADEDMNITLFNPAAESMFGYTAREVIGSPIGRLIPERFREAHAGHMRAFGASATTTRRMNERGRIAGLRANGEEFPAEATISHVVLDGKRFYIAILADVTADVEAVRSLQLFAEVFNTSVEGIAVTDAENRILLVNPAFTAITGYADEEARGHPLSSLSPCLWNDGIHAEMDAALRREGRWQGEIWDWRKNGEPYCKRLSISTVKNERGEIIYRTAIFYDVTERKRAEEALRESERRLKTLMDNLYGMAYRCRNDRQWTMEFLSAGCEELTGYPPEDFVSNKKRSYDELILPEDREYVWDTVQAALAARGKYALEYRIRTASGAVKWVWEQGCGIFGDKGDVIALEGFILDITERKLAQQVQARLAAIVENSDDAIISRALDGTITSWNAGAERLFGWTAEEVVGRSISDLIQPPEERDRTRRNIEAIRRGEVIPPYETRRVTRDGRLIDVLASVSPIRDETGTVVGAAVILRDISALKQAQAQRQESDERFRAAFEQAGVGMALRDIDPHHTRWLRVNQKLCEMLGYTAPELLALTSTDITHPDDRKEGIAWSERLWRGEIPSYSREKRYLRKDGTTVWVNVSASVLKDARSNPYQVLTIYQDITERKLAEQELERQKKFSESIIQSLPGILFVFDRQGTILRWNARLEEVSGYPAAEIGAMCPLQFLHDKHRALAAQRIETMLACGQAELTADLVTRDGRSIPFHFSGNRVDLDDEALFLVIGIDITERKRAEEARSMLAAIVEHSTEAIVGRALDGSVTSWNAAAERLFGYTAAEAIGKSGFLTPPELKDERKQIRELWASGRPVATFETVRLAKGGRRVHVLEVAFPVKDSNGKTIGGAALYHDITEQVAARRRAAMEYSVNRALADAETVGQVMPGVIRTMCEAMGWAYGARWAWNEAESRLVRAEYWADFEPDFEPSERDYWYRLGDGPPGGLLRRAWLMKETTWIADLQKDPSFLRRRSCVKHGLRSAYSFPIYASGAVIGVMEFLGRDVREPDETLLRSTEAIGRQIGQFIRRKQAEEALIRLNAELEQRVADRTRRLESINKELEAFSYSVSHDLRAPLRGIDGFSQVLLKNHSKQLDPTGIDYLQRIRRATVRMGELIDDLLQLSRVSSSEIRISRVNLSQIARNTLAELRERDPARRVAIEVQDGIEVTADDRLLRIALENLLNNAWKFTRKNPDAHIFFGAFEQNGEQIVFVRDNGAGFDMKYAGKLFGAFQRLHSTSEFEGTGIGLAIVQRIINLHGGRVWAEAAVNQGATFYFSVPRCAFTGRGSPEREEKS